MPGTEGQADPGTAEIRPTDLGRLEAIGVLLSGIVQGRYRRETDAMLETAMNDTNMVEAQQTIQREAKTLFTRFCGRPGTVCETLMCHYMTVIATLSSEEGVRLADKVNATNMAEAQQTIQREAETLLTRFCGCLLYTSPSPRDS